ncbi:hypothetical protein TWF718_003414 [Orbilia javanica]|uniref:Uncharacterized protein n=1 Tax=Orbilia javanica TaxID=47235 RepID=A0AAN8MEM2_9PEZI
MDESALSRLFQLPAELRYEIFSKLISEIPLTVTYYSPIHTIEWREEMERLGASAEMSEEWNRELPCAALLSIPEPKDVIPIKYCLISRRFTNEMLQAATDRSSMLLLRLEKCLQPMICADFLSYTTRSKCTNEFNDHLLCGRVIFGGIMPNTSNTLRETLLPEGVQSIFMTKSNFLGKYTEEFYWGPVPGQIYGSPNEPFSWIGLANLYQYFRVLGKVAVTMRGDSTLLDDYVYWFLLEAFRWLDNGSIKEIELVYDEEGPTENPPDIWDELLNWAGQDWKDSAGSLWTFGWHGLEYVKKWSTMNWEFERVLDRKLNQRGRFVRYWDIDDERCWNGVVEEVVVWSVKKGHQQYNMVTTGFAGMPRSGMEYFWL